MKPPSLEKLNSWRIKTGEKPISNRVYSKIILAFSYSGGKFNSTAYFRLQPAFRKYGEPLFSMKIKCETCEEILPFTSFRFATKIGGFYESCKECGVSDYQGFRKFNIRRVEKGEKPLSILKYKALKAIYRTRFGNYNPHLKKAIKKMETVFGSSVLLKKQECRHCKERKEMALFTPDYSRKRIYQKCRVCTAKDQAMRRAKARKRKKSKVLGSSLRKTG